MRDRHSILMHLVLAALVLNSLHPKKQAAEPAKTPPEVALHAYIDRVRAQHAAEDVTEGSIRSPEGRLVRLGTDAKVVRIAFSKLRETI